MNMEIEPEKDEVSIVLLGRFNPTIFQPLWFGHNNLISIEAAQDAELSIIHPEISQFTASDIAFSVELGRFQVKCETIHKDRIKDLVIGSFGNFLIHTPIWTLGINRDIHFPCRDEPTRMRLGSCFAPLEPWGGWGLRIKKDMETEKRHGGMTRLVMKQEPRLDGNNGYTKVDLQPSSILKEENAVFIEVNDHFELSPPKETLGCKKVIETLNKSWDESIQQSGYIINEVMKLAKTV